MKYWLQANCSYDYLLDIMFLSFGVHPDFPEDCKVPPNVPERLVIGPLYIT